MTADAANRTGRFATLPGWLAVIGLLALVTLRLIVTFSPQIYWLVDPRSDTGISTEFGPTGAAVTNLLAVLVLALAVTDRLVQRQRIHTLLIALWLVGFAFALWHPSHTFDSLCIGGSWIGAIALALAALHLGSHPAFRRVLLAGFIALLVPLGIQAVHQVTLDHAATVRDYEVRRDEIARQHGWAEGSLDQRLYERRLYQIEATGRLGFSNIFGTVTAALSLAAIGVAAAMARRMKIAKPQAAVMAAVCALGLAALALTFSKGAIGAMALTLGGVGAACFVAWRFRFGAWWWRIAAMAIVAAGVIVVVLRGLAVPPDTAAGERSLLFRWHYWQASASMITEHPLPGVGPAEFKSHYLLHKNPLNPEEVADPHNVFVTFIATLGVGGVAWSLLLLALLWHAAKGVTHLDWTPASPPDPGAPRRWPIIAAAATLAFGAEFIMTLAPLGGAVWLLAGICLGMAALGAAMIVGRVRFTSTRADHADPRSGTVAGGVFIALACGIGLVALPPLGLWFTSAVAFVALAGWLSGCIELDAAVARLGLFTAAVALLLHSQIEMSLTNAMSAPLLMSVLGLAAARSDTMVPPPRWKGFVSVAAVAVAAIAFAIFNAQPIHLVQGWLRRAAADLRAGRGHEAANTLQKVSAGPFPKADAAIDRARIHFEIALQPGTEPNVSAMHLEAAFEALEQARWKHNLAALWRAEAGMAREAARLTNNPLWLARALAAAEEMLKHDPYSINAHMLAADIAWDAMQPDLARRWYSRAMELSELSYLDPDKQLTDADRRRIEERLK